MILRLALMANDRPSYFIPVTAHWQQARGLDQWDPYVSLEPTSYLAEMHAIATERGFPVKVNPARWGVLHHPWRILESLFAEHHADFAVIAEDDVLVSDDILEYYTWAAKRFADERVLAVCSSSFREQASPAEDYRAVVHTGFTAMCWGTWGTRWQSVLRDTWDHNYSSGTPDAPQSGWDWNFNLRIIPQGNWQVVSPAASRTDHIGAVGTHTTAASFPGSRSATFVQHRDPGEFHL